MPRIPWSEILKRWLVLELVFTVLIAAHLGVEGLARMFCDVFPVEECEEIDWSQE
jgi:hypothetical protein